jgi:transketolase
VLRESNNDLVTVVAAGITLFEALSAYEELKKDGIFIRVVDLYSLKPVDSATLHECAKTTKAIITVEDHFSEGGLGDAVKSSFTSLPVPFYCLAVTKMPRSGKPQELLDYEGISKNAIIKKIKEMI